MQLLWICAAGAAGTGLRHLVTVWAAARWGATFPYGTLTVNIVGCFAIAVVMHVSSAAGWSATTRVVVTTGLLGGFTTYSAFNQETLRLIDQGAGGVALMNVLVTLGGGVLGGWLGMLIAGWLVPR
jgi:CrcB protein